MMESMAKKATVPVILHWDHGRNWTILKNRSGSLHELCNA